MSRSFVNNSYVKSAIISGRQWDRTMQFVNGKLDGNGKVFDVTANSGANVVCNIYDLLGGLWEFTAERHSDITGLVGNDLYRGRDSASGRFTSKGEASAPVGFRFVLYVM